MDRNSFTSLVSSVLRRQTSHAGAPVSLFILKSNQKVRDYAGSVKNARVLRRDRTTVVFEDGRVITSDVEAASRHLNALGWSTRKLQIVASFPRRPSGRRSFG